MADLSILIVEDDGDLCDAMEMALMGEGFDTIVAKSIKEAKEKLSNQTFKTLLVDIRLTDGGGDELIEKVRTKKELKNLKTPIIVVSGFLDKDLVLKIRPHIQGALVKPFDTQALISSVKKLAH